MAKRDTIQDSLDRLSAIRDNPDTDEGRRVLRAALEKGVGMAVEKASRLIADVACGSDVEDDWDWTRREEVVDEAWAGEFMPLLAGAFERLCAKPDSDPVACGKIAAATALNRMASDDVDLFLRGISFRQMGWGYEVTPPLRGVCGLALVRLRYRGRLRILTDMLWDNWEDARVGAVRALLYEGTEAAEMILRAKYHGGDKGADVPGKHRDGGARVLGEIAGALLSLDGDGNAGFVASIVSSNEHEPAARDEVALVMGESRLPASLRELGRLWGGSVEVEERERVLRGVAVMGTDDAMELIAGWVASESEKGALRWRGVLEDIWGVGSGRVRRIFEM